MLVDQTVKIKETATKLIVSADKRVLELIEGHFMYQPPDHWRAASFVIWKMSNGERGWDGWDRPFKLKYEFGKCTGTIARGRITDVIDLCKTKGWKIDRSELLPRPFLHVTLDDIHNDLIKADFVLGGGQKECILGLVREAMGMCHVTVSGGKTALLTAAASFVKEQRPKTRWLYLTPTERLANQITKSVSGFKPDWDVTQYGAGKKDNTGEDMVVATGAMLWTHFKELVKAGWFKSFGGVIADECHRSSSKTWTAILNATPAFWRFSASDTLRSVDEDPKDYYTLRGLNGPVLHSIKAAPLIISGRIAKPYINIVDHREWIGKFSGVPHSPELESDAWAYLNEQWYKGVYNGPVYELDQEGERTRDRKGNEIKKQGFHSIQIGEHDYEVESEWCLLNRTIDKAIIQFKARNHAVAAWARYYSDQDKHTLIVATRSIHVLALQKIVAAAVGPDLVRILVGTDSTKKRDETFEWTIDTPGGVLISPLVKEGVSINELDAGIIADHVVSYDLARQILGRFLRKKDYQDHADITMFYDHQHPKLKLNSKRLLKKLQEIQGFAFRICTNPGTEVNAKLIEAAEPLDYDPALDYDSSSE